MFINIYSFANKELKLELYLQEMDVIFLCVTEKWLRQHELFISIANYKVVRLQESLLLEVDHLTVGTHNVSR